MSNKKDIVSLYKSSKYGKLISGLIHNLNTPIMGISGRLELIQMKNQEIKGLDKIETQLSRINRILKNVTYIIDVDKNMNDHLVSIREVIEQFDIFYKSNMNYKHRREIKLDVNNNVVADINASILLNVLSLATDYILDHTQDGALITVSLKTEDTTAGIDMCFKHDSNEVPPDFKFSETMDFDDNLELKLLCALIVDSEFTIDFKTDEDVSWFHVEFPSRKSNHTVEEDNDFLLDDDDGEIDIEALLTNAPK